MQLTTLAKKSFKGFTLIELLVVIAIIGLLSTIVAAPVQSARKKAKDTKKVAEMKQLQTALASYANDNGQFPSGSSTVSSLSSLVPVYIPALPTSLTNTAPRDHTMFVSYASLPVGAASTTTSDYKVFAYHLGVTLEVYNPVLLDDADCWGTASVATANSGTTAGLKLGGPCQIFTSSATSSLNVPSYVGSSTSPIAGPLVYALSGVTSVQPASTSFIFATNSYVSHPMWPSSVADFSGDGIAEAATSTCTTIDQCIFDVADAY